MLAMYAVKEIPEMRIMAPELPMYWLFSVQSTFPAIISTGGNTNVSATSAPREKRYPVASPPATIHIMNITIGINSIFIPPLYLLAGYSRRVPFAIFRFL
jgi:hypothetical protein